MWAPLLVLLVLCGTGVVAQNYQTFYMSGSCGLSFSLYDSGYIQWSPDWDYGNNEDCSVVFYAADPDAVISLQFPQVNMQACVDHLYIYNGASYNFSGVYYNTPSVTASEDVCNHNIPAEFVSTGNFITLRLTSDGSIGGTFTLLYTLYWGSGHSTGAGESSRIRLVGGTSSNEGRVEVRQTTTSAWGTVCDDRFDMNDATVVCRSLGYSGAQEVRDSAGFGQGSGSIYMDDVACTGAENSLLDCPYAGWGVHNCGHGEDVGVVCFTSATPSCSADYFQCSSGFCISSALQCDGATNCRDGEDENCAERLRLVGGSGAHEGRLEVRPQDSYVWGTVCDDRFDMDDADVACRMLGYSEATEVHSSAYFGEGTGLIYMDDLQCTGDENSLFDCPYAGWEVHNCGHSEDVGIVCNSGGLSGGEIAGIVVGVLVGIVVLTVIVHQCSKSGSNSSPANRVDPNRMNNGVHGPSTAPQLNTMTQQPVAPITMSQTPLPPIPTSNKTYPPPQQFPPPPAYNAALAMPAPPLGGPMPYPIPYPSQDPAYAPPPQPPPSDLLPPPDPSVPPAPRYLPPLTTSPQLPPP